MKNKLNDITLIARCLVFDDRKAYALLIEKYQIPVRRMFLNLTFGDEMLSDDLAQETFIKIYLNLSKFKAASSFSTWIYRIGYNVFYDYVKNSRKREFVSLDMADNMEMKESVSLDKKMDIYQALKILSEKERSAILFFYIQDLAIEDIAAVMDCPEGTVKSHLSRAKVKLGDYFKQIGYAYE